MKTLNCPNHCGLTAGCEGCAPRCFIFKTTSPYKTQSLSQKEEEYINKILNEYQLVGQNVINFETWLSEKIKGAFSINK